MPNVYPTDSLDIDFDLVGEQDLLLDLVILEDYYQNTTAPMRAGKIVAIHDMEQRFEDETAPDGEQWAYWADSYAPTAEAENVGILRKTEDMYYAATAPSSFVVTPEGLFFSTTNLDNSAPFWYTHQYGRIKKKMVPRPFIGLSEHAEAEIDNVFLQWVERGGEVFIRGGKEIESHVFRAPTGQFMSALK